MRNTVILVLLFYVSLIHAKPVLYDDFESYEHGSVTSTTSGKWMTDAGSADIALSAYGKHICNNNDSSSVYSSLGTYAIAASDTQTTVFFRFHTDLNEDSLIGVCDNGDITPDNYADMDAYLIVGKNDTIYARNGSGEYDLFTGRTAASGWYNAWLIINANNQTYDVYINQGDANATENDRKAVGMQFRAGASTGSSIVSFANLWGAGLSFDDIYITPGLDLTNPPVLTINSGGNLLLWWAMNEGEGTIAADSSPNNYDGNISNASWNPGGYDNNPSCLDFDGGRSVITRSNAGLFLNDLDAITVSMWVKSDVTNTDKGFFDTESPDSQDDTLGIRYDRSGYSGGGTNVIKAAISTTGGIASIESSSDAQSTSWQHIVLTWQNGSSLKLYINGIEDELSYDDGPVFGIITNTNQLIIGKGAHDSSSTGWDGLIDQVAIFNRQLQSSEIESLYNGQNPSTIETFHPMAVTAGIDRLVKLNAEYTPIQMTPEITASIGQEITQVQWSLVSGPADISFCSITGKTENDSNAVVYVSQPGTYIFNVKASDSTPQSMDDQVTITAIEGLKGDIFSDNTVDILDLQLFCIQWLDSWQCMDYLDGCANISGQDSVDLKDYAYLAMQWQINSVPLDSNKMYLSGIDKDDTVQWDFYCTGGRNSGFWTKIDVPSHWEQKGFGTYNYGYETNKSNEKGLYQHTFSIAHEWAGQRILLYFDGVMTDAEVIINGQAAGPVHQGGFYQFKYDITDKVNFGGADNLLEVNVSKVSADASVEQAERNADYWVFGGIYRPVYLKAVPDEYIDWTSIDAKADGTFAADIYIKNQSTVDSVSAQITKLDGTPVGNEFQQQIASGQSRVSIASSINNPDLWSAEKPNLYYVNFSLYAGQNEVQTIRQRFGFRTIEVRAGDGIYLNGTKIILKGVNRHCFWPESGRCLNRSLSYNDIQMIKDMNMNAVRMSHYPPDEYFLDYCDELGLYVLDELAGWQTPTYNTDIGEKLVKEMLVRDVNHPSILFWDNGNEGGWNTDLDDDYAIYDKQNRAVLHPWTTFSGINTDHYETYGSVQNILNGSNLFMPTEFLHGLYDGGHGAGLNDYWNLMMGSPLGAGGFLWVFADEGIVRTDIPGFIDTYGNAAPDGIVGPFHGKEGSFYTIKEIWCPVQISLADITDNFDGVLPLKNLYAFSNLSECRFKWQLVDFKTLSDIDAGYNSIDSGILEGPDLSPGQSGSLTVPLPADWQNRDALYLTVTDSENRELMTWSWEIQPPQKIRQNIVDLGSGNISSSISQNVLTVIAENVLEIKFDLNDGKLLQASAREQLFSLNNGPRRVPGGSGIATVTYGPGDDHYFIQASNSQGLDTFRWQVYPSGWVKLIYQYSMAGEQDYFGITFDYPEKQVISKRWMGEGPYRVWKNRMKGTQLNVWEQSYNDAKPGLQWQYPEFKGYFSNMYWTKLNTRQGDITFVTDTENLYLRLFTPQNGRDPRTTATSFPEGDISFLHGIPPIGTKFHAASQLGPESQKNQTNSSYQGVLYFYFGQP